MQNFSKTTPLKLPAKTKEESAYQPNEKRPRPFRVFSKGIFFVLFLVLAFLTKGDSRPATLNASARDVVILNFGQVYQREISTGECQIYLIQLSGNQYVRLGLEQTGVDLVFTLLSPGSKVLAKMENREGGLDSVSMISEAKGLHRLEVRALEKTQTRGSYQLKIVAAHEADSRDKQKIAGERAFVAGEKFRVQSQAHASREAIKNYESAYVQWNSAGETLGAAKALKAIGEVHYQLSEVGQALVHYQQALAVLSVTPSSGLEAEIRTDISYVYIHLGDYSQALDHATQAKSLSESAGELRRKAQTLNCLSEVAYAFGDRWKALEYAKEALVLWQSIGDRRWRAVSLLSIGCLYNEIGETGEVANYFDQVLAIYTAVSDRRGQALAKAALATLKANLGDSQNALTLYTESLETMQAAGDRFWEASVLQNIGSIYQDLSDYNRALNYFHKALPIWKAIESPANEAGSLSNIGWLYYLADDKQQALAHFQQVLKVSNALADKKYQSNALRKIGAVYSSLGDKKQALTYYQQALLLHREDGEWRGEASAHNEIGKLYRSLHRLDQARISFNRALALNQEKGDRFAAAETLYQLACVEADVGNFAKASSEINAALGIVEELRTNVVSHNLRVTYFASIQRYFEFYLAVLMQQRLRLPAAGFDAQALTVNERARARSLIELLAEAGANIHQGADPALIEQTRQLQKQISILAERKIRMINTNAPAPDITAVSVDIDTLSEKRDQIESLIRNKNPHYAALTLPKPLTSQQIQQMLDGDTLLLEFSLGDKRSFVWSVTPAGVKGHELGNRAQIERLVREVYDILAPKESAPVQLDATRTEAYRKKAAELSRLILGPVAEELGQKRLVIVADGILQYIPFGALPMPQMGGKQSVGKESSAANTAYIPLIQEHEVVSLPSASTLAVLRQETAGRKLAPKAIAVLADPVFADNDLRLLAVNGQANGTLPSEPALGDLTSQLRTQSLKRGGSFKRLRGTLEEATAIEGLTKPGDRFVATGFDATLQQATNPILSQYRIIHLATHGVLDDENPELSALVFSLFDKQGKALEGRLWLNDIYNLNLPAELVVLSACDTGLGKEFKGEGLVGLTRGFMYAGAPRVMASLWKVEDKPTAQLMRRFYLHLLKEGLPPAAALRQAQLDLFRDTQWNAPYYWGSFVLQGEWK